MRARWQARPWAPGRSGPGAVRRWGRLRPVGHASAPGSVPAAGQELAQPADLDVAARRDDRHPFAVPDRDPAGEQRRQGRGAGRLEDLLQPLDREAHPGQDRRIVEQDDVVEVAPAHRQRPGAGERRAQPVGDAVRLDPDDLAAFEADA